MPLRFKYLHLSETIKKSKFLTDFDAVTYSLCLNSTLNAVCKPNSAQTASNLFAFYVPSFESEMYGFFLLLQ